MADNNLMLEILKEIRATVHQIEQQQHLQMLELRAIHSREGARVAETHATSAAIGDLQDRLRRIETRIDLNDS